MASNGSSRFGAFHKLAVLLGALFVVAGCATSPRVPSLGADPMPPGPQKLVLASGDTVSLQFVYWPELDITQTIRPDGMITAKLISEVEAAGLSPEELRQKLLELYADKLRDPEITVVADLADSRKVYVGGEVDLFRNTDGLVEVPLVGKLTPFQAVLQAGGFRKRSAKLSRVLVIRRIDDTQYARTVDLRKEFKTAESELFYLQSDDIVFVPRSRIDRADAWVDQYMNQLVPDWINANFGYTETRTKTVGTRSTVTASPTGFTVERTR